MIIVEADGFQLDAGKFYGLEVFVFHKFVFYLIYSERSTVVDHDHLLLRIHRVLSLLQLEAEAAVAALWKDKLQ